MPRFETPSLELNSDFERYSFFPNLKNYIETHSVKIFFWGIPFFSRRQEYMLYV